MLCRFSYALDTKHFILDGTFTFLPVAADVGFFIY